MLTVGLMTTALWQGVIVAVLGASWRPWLMPLVLVGGLTAAASLARLKLRRLEGGTAEGTRIDRRLARAAVVGGVAAVLAAPAAWSLTPVLGKGSGLFPPPTPHSSPAEGCSSRQAWRLEIRRS